MAEPTKAEVVQAITDAAERYVAARPDPSNAPIRQKSARGVPKPEWDLERRCSHCGASFEGLAPGKTGERGLWLGTGWQWLCSQECADEWEVSRG